MRRPALASVLATAAALLAVAPAHGQTPAPPPAERSRWTSPGEVGRSPVPLDGIAVDQRGIGVVGVGFGLAAGEPDGDPCKPSIPADRASVTFPDGTGQGGDPVAFETSVTFPCNGSWSVVARIAYRRPQVVAETEDVTLPLTVALPAATPTGLTVARDPNGTALSWRANTEPDFRSYVIERSEDGGSTWTDITAGVTITQTAVVDDEGTPTVATRYRLRAVRGRPSVAAVVSAPSDAVPVPPAPPTTTAGAGSPAAPTLGTSLGELRSRSASSPVAAAPPAPPTTIDSGFAETLPFAAAPPVTVAPPTTLAAPPADAPVVAILEGVAEDRKALLVPLAGALALAMLAAHLRHLARRAKEPA